MTPEEAVARLKEAPWLNRAETQAVFALLAGAENKVRAVGGIVRDTILGIERPDAEIDFSTEFLPAEVMERARRAGYPVFPTGLEHGTVTIRVGRLAAEVTTLRQDIETDGRHAVVRFGTDWRRDAERRDFTMNALYAGMDGRLFDPLGGLADCLARMVRFIGDPDRRIEEDRLRVFRFFRFSGSHGQGTEGRFDPAGLAACRRAAGKLGTLSAERVGAEMQRILSLPVAAPIVEAMSESGVLALSSEVLAALAAYDRLGSPPLLAGRLALIAGSQEETEALKQAWRLSNQLVREASELLELAALLNAGDVGDVVARAPNLARAAASVAAASGRHDAHWHAELLAEIARLEVLRGGRHFPLSGADLIARGFEPGPALGAELGRLRRAWIDSGFTLDREALLAWAEK